jgi:VWFA-related protein
VLLDRLNTDKTLQPYSNRKVVEYLQKNGNQDPIGIYVMGTGVHAIQELTDDPARLERAVRSLKTQDARRITADVTADPTGMAETDAMVAKALEALQDFEVKDRVAITRDSLIAIARHLAKVPGRKNLVWISSSFPLIIQRAHETIEFTNEVDEAARALADANVAVYMVDARGLAPSGMGSAENGPAAGCRGACAPQLKLATGGPSGVDTMNRITGLTGGQAFYNTNGIDESIKKAVDDSQLTYTVGFYASEDTFDDRYHKLVVKVDKRNLDVRFRPGYFATKVPAGSQTAAPTFEHLMLQQLDEVAIGMTVQASADPAQAGAYRVQTWIDLHDIHLELQGKEWHGEVNLSLYLAGAKSARTITRKITIPEDGLAAALVKPVEIVSTITDNGAATELRAMAQDKATGAAGSVRVPLHREQGSVAK